MKNLKITSDNHEYIVKRYVDHIVSHMDIEDFYDTTKEYLFKEKLSYPLETLEEEIKRYSPDLLKDYLVEQVVGKEKEYAKTF